jgi:hypothetical protein
VTVDPATGGGCLTGGVLSVTGTLAVTTVGTPTAGSTYYVLPANSFSGTFPTVSSGTQVYSVIYNGAGQPGGRTHSRMRSGGELGTSMPDGASMIHPGRVAPTSPVHPAGSTRTTAPV